MGEFTATPIPGVSDGVIEVGSGIATSLDYIQSGTTDLNGLLSILVDAAETTSSIEPINSSLVSLQSQISAIDNLQQDAVSTYNAAITKTLTVPPDSVVSSGVGSVTGADRFTYTVPDGPDPLPIESNFSTPPPSPPIEFNQPKVPTLNTVTASFSHPPPSASVGSVSTISLGSAPVLSDTPPTAGNITAPSAFNKSAPTAQALPEHALPTPITDTFPGIPELHTLTLPAAPVLSIIMFDGVLPSPLESPPDVDFNFIEVAYGSPLNTELRKKFISYVMNEERTSLAPAIEQQSHDQYREEQAKLVRKSTDIIKKSYARAGWMMPAGKEIDDVLAAFEDTTDLDIKNSRKITEEQGKLEQSNFHFAIGKALEYEGQLINLHNNVCQRSLDAARFAVEAAVSLYEVKVSYLNASISLYTTQAEVYAARIQAELTKLEIFKAQIDGVRLLGDINKQDIALYRAQIEAVVAMFDLYKLELMGVKTQIEGDSLKVQNFGVAIKAFAAEVKAKALEFDGYVTALTGEEIKAKIYNSLVSAYSKQVSAYKAEVSAKAKELEANIKVNVTAPVQISEQELEKFSALVDAEMSRIDVIVDHNRNAAKLFSAEVEGENARVKSEVDIYQSDVKAFESVVERDSVKASVLNDANKTTAKIFETQVSAESDIIKAVVELDGNRIEAFNTATKRAEAIGMAGAEYNQIAASAYSAISQASTINEKTKAEIKNIEAMIQGAQLRETVAGARSTVMQAVAANSRAAQAAISSMQINAQMSAAMISIHSYTDSKTWTKSESYSHDDYSQGTHVSRTTVHSE